MYVIASEASTAPGQPKEQSPQPPLYAACIAYMRAYGSKMVDPIANPTPERLKARCEHEYRKLKLKALYTLIVGAWLDGEATEMHVRPTDAELRQRLASFQRQFPTQAAFKGYLAGTGATRTDLSQYLRQGLLVERIKQKLETASANQHLAGPARQRALDRFGAEFKTKWTSRTDCRPGYVVPLCRQYRAPSTPPELVPPAVPLTNQPAGG